MRIITVWGLLTAAYLVPGLVGLPVDRELFRVKRKGVSEIDHDVELVRKVRRSQDDRETEIRHKRRFFATEATEQKTEESYKTKMEARSSRSSREDNDITARRPERFRVRIHKRSPDDGGSSLVAGEASGSGEQPGKSSTSGSGFWTSKVKASQGLKTKKTDKRSMGTSSLDSLISALTAISSLAPEEQDTSGEDIEFSGSGLWLAPEKEVENDKLTTYFKEEGNSGSGENPEEALSMINEAAEKELKKKVEDESGRVSKREAKVASKETQHETGEKLFRRELKSDSLADDLMAAVENAEESHDSEPEDNFTSSSGSAMQEKEDEITNTPEEDVISGQPEEDEGKPEVQGTPEVHTKPEVKNSEGDVISGQPEKDENEPEVKVTPEVHTKPEVKSLRSLTDVLLPDSFYRARRSSQENAFLRSDRSFGENDALDSNSLVARFYREQDAHADAPEVMEASVASLPSETEAAFGTESQVKPEKRETYYEHSGDFSEPRVVYTREIRNAPEPIIERPAVYSRSADESEMDSSFGGEDDDDEATLMIHEREIREDGYVGCYEDKSPDRDLPTVLSVGKLTPDSCRSACQGAGHAYAGVQYGYLCRCGDSYGKYTKVPDEECNALCSGDKAQKCGGFWRSAIFTTAGAMQPTKRGNFFHIDSVQPMTEDIFDIPRSEIPSAAESSDDPSTMTESATITETASLSPEEHAPAPTATMPESSGSGTYIQEIHRDTSFQESPVPSTPGVTVHESPMSSNPGVTIHESPLSSNPEGDNLKDETVAHAQSGEPTQDKGDDSVTHASAAEPAHVNEDSSTAHSPNSAPANNPVLLHDALRMSASRDSPKAPSQASQRSDIEATPQQVTVPLDSPVSANQETPRVAHPQHHQAPQGTHVSQLVYLHQQQDILSKPTPRTIVAVPPKKVSAGTVAYTGTIKLKQSWLDQFEDGNSAEYKILTGNIEQAFKRIFKNEPKFINAEVVGFREGLIKHNPNTIRKVIAPFTLTFKDGAKGIQEKLKTMVKNLGRLDDMPVYKNSLQIAEYGHLPAAEKAKTVNDTVKEKQDGAGDEKRSAVNVPNGGVDPFLKGIFNQIST